MECCGTLNQSLTPCVVSFRFAIEKRKQQDPVLNVGGHWQLSNKPYFKANIWQPPLETVSDSLPVERKYWNCAQ